jgi:hypothetical protein
MPTMPFRSDRRLGIRALCASLILLAAASVAQAAELLMFRRDGCPWCAMWDREIGPIYGKTDIGRRVPLRMVDLPRERTAGIRTRGPILYTPTFVLVANGQEQGRIEGYPGEAFFWGLLERLVATLPAGGQNGALVHPVIAADLGRAP